MSARARTKKAVRFHLALFIWRRLFAQDIWGRLLFCLGSFGFVSDDDALESEPGHEGGNVDFDAPLPVDDLQDGWGRERLNVQLDDYMFERSEGRYQQRLAERDGQSQVSSDSPSSDESSGEEFEPSDSE